MGKGFRCFEGIEIRSLFSGHIFAREPRIFSGRSETLVLVGNHHNIITANQEIGRRATEVRDIRLTFFILETLRTAVENETILSKSMQDIKLID